jgi:hypothetical protein
MTKRQTVGFALFCGLLLGLAFFYWLAPILDYRAPRWVFYVLGPLIASGWGWYYQTTFAKKPEKEEKSE